MILPSAPIAVAPADTAGVSEAQLPARPRVLLVDDDHRNLLALREVLEDVAEIVTADSGAEALRHLLKGHFAVILLDVLMPGLDGYETAKLVRMREQSRDTPIIFLTAINKEDAHLMRGYDSGAVDFVFKPVDPVITLRDITEQRRLAQPGFSRSTVLSDGRQFDFSADDHFGFHSVKVKASFRF